MSVKTLNGQELMFKAMIYLFEIGENMKKYDDDITETVTYTLAPTSGTEEMEIDIPLHEKELLVNMDTLDETVECPFPVMGVIITLYEEEFPQEFKFRIEDDPSGEVFILKKEERCQCKRAECKSAPKPDEDKQDETAGTYSTITIIDNKTRIASFSADLDKDGLEKIEVTIPPISAVNALSPEYIIIFKGRIEEKPIQFKGATPHEVYSYDYLVLDIYNEKGEKGMYLLRKDDWDTLTIIDKTSDIGLTKSFEDIASSSCARLYSEGILYCGSLKLWIANAWGINIKPTTNNYTWESFFKRIDSFSSSMVSIKPEPADARDVEANPYIDKLIMGTIKYPIAYADKERYTQLVEDKLNMYNVDEE